MFKFGEINIIKFIKIVDIPMKIASVPVILTTDVIDYDIPLLLSKETMEKANSKINFKEDKGYNFGKKVDIKLSSSRYYCIDIKNETSAQADNSKIVLLCTSLRDISKDEKYKVALKPHTQFAHPHSDKIKALLRGADRTDNELEKYLVDIDTSCYICIKYKKAKSRQCVGPPMAQCFNETVAMDLKQWSSSPSIWFLHLMCLMADFSSGVIQGASLSLIFIVLFGI